MDVMSLLVPVLCVLVFAYLIAIKFLSRKHKLVLDRVVWVFAAVTIVIITIVDEKGTNVSKMVNLLLYAIFAVSTGTVIFGKRKDSGKN